MNKYIVSCWVVLLLLMVLLWLLATILPWLYTAGYEGKDGEGTKVGEVAAILQSSSLLLYLLYIISALVWLGAVGRADSCWTYCCLVVGIPLFAAVPLVCTISLLVSAFQNPDPAGVEVGIAAAVLCLASTSVCLCVTIFALFCGSTGKGKTSRYPSPLAYLPLLERTQRREDSMERGEASMYTDDYPTPLHMLPPRKSLTRESVERFLPESRRKSSLSYSPGDKPRRYSLPVGSEPRRKVSTASTFSTTSGERERRTYYPKGSEISSFSGESVKKSPSSKTQTFWTRRFSKASNPEVNGQHVDEVAPGNKRSNGRQRRHSTGDLQKTRREPHQTSRARKHSTPSFAESNQKHLDK